MTRISRRAALLVPGIARAVSLQPPPIDRRVLVRRHNPVLRALDARSPLSVGNGEFAFTADITGLQSFPEPYASGTPLCTQAQWGWHSFTGRNRDHPSMLAACGVLPGGKVDRDTMRRTLRKVLDVWRWADTWGWDYPMVAMTAARVGEPEIAVAALLMDTPKNRWLPNGHNWQRPNLPLYLPGNGGLLAAVAMMAAGWRGGPNQPAPGFPSNWTVRSEGLRAYDT